MAGLGGLVMDFIHGAASPFEHLGRTDIENPIKQIIAQGNPLNGNNANEQVANQQSNEQLGLGAQGTDIDSALRQWAGNSVQAIGDVVVPGVAKGIEGPIADAVGGVAGKTLAGAAAGTVIGGAYGAAGAESGSTAPSGKDLTMDFLTGAATGGVLGGGLAGGVAALKGAIKPAYAAHELLSDEDLQKMADTDNEKTIQKTLEPVTGPVVAKELSPAVAAAKYPEVIKNIVDNNLNNKLTPDTTGTAQPLPSPEPLPPTTPTSNVNTPAQVAGEATAAEASYTPEQASLDQTAPAPDFMNKPDEEQPKTTTVGRAGAMSGMNDILNNGGTVDEAMNHYMENTGEGYAQAQKAVQNLMGSSDESLQKGKINASLNPEYERASKLLPEGQAGDPQRPVINTRVVHNELKRLATNAFDTGDKLSDNDRNLMNTIHGKTLQDLLPDAEDKQKFTDAFNALKKYDDTKQGLAAGQLDVDVPYRQNHGLTMRWENPDEEVKAAQNQKVQLTNKPGYAGPRTIQNYEEGRQLGLTPKNDNIYQDLQDDLKSSQSSLGQLALAKGLRQAYPDQVKIGEIGTDAEKGPYKQLQIPYGQKLSMPADIADQINARAPAPTTNGFWKGYDSLNGNWKNLKLAGGGFHGLNTFGNWLGSQIGSGRIFTPAGIRDTGRVVRSLFDSDFTDKLTKQWDNNGGTLKEDQAGLNATIHGEDASKGLTGTESDIKTSGISGNIPILKQMHTGVFGREIPTMMKLLFHAKTDNLDFSDPDQLAEGTKIAKQINQQFGAQNRDIQGLTPRTVKYLNRGVLAEGWNEGQLATLKDAITKGGPDGALARQTVFGKALLFGGLATAGGALGGEFKNKSPKDIAFDILSKTVNPEFQAGNYTIGLPTTQLAEVGKPTLETAQDLAEGKKAGGPLEDFASSRLAAIPSAAEQIASNRNFSGNPIRGTDYYGRPISPEQTAASIAGMAAPIPVAQGIQQGSGEQNLGASLANTLGVNARQTNTLEYAPIWGQTYISELQKTPGVTKQQINADTQFFELLGSGNASKSKTLDSAISAAEKGNQAKAQQIINKYNQGIAKQLMPWAENPQNAQYFDNTMAEILRGAFLSTKSVNSNLVYDAKTNPTAYGVPIQALAANPVNTNQGSQ